MNNIELITNGSIKEIREAVINRKLYTTELVNFFIQRIKNNKINSFISLYEDDALKRAEELDKKLKNCEKPGKLFGIPYAVKDNIAVKGYEVTCASKMLKNYKATYNATVINKLNDEDAIFLGKTNLDEFAMGSSTETSYFGTTLNPWDNNRVPGGSSGGSAAAIASRESVFALGSDTGGSIRQPAAFCGVTGLKATYGFVSRFGLVAFASSLDQVGPIGRSAEDLELIFSIISGFDEKDTTTKKIENYKVSEPTKRKFNIAYTNDIFGEEISPDIKNNILSILNLLKEEGHSISEVTFNFSKHSVPVYQILSCSEASSNLARYDGIRYGYQTKSYKSLLDLYNRSRGEGFGEEVKRRILFGTYILMAKNNALYTSSFKVSRLIRKNLENIFTEYDVFITPTTFSPPFKIGEIIDDPIKMHHSDAFTSICNLSGNPGISIPLGLTGNNLPIGMQIIAKRFDENNLFQFAKYIQSITDYHKCLPEGVK